MDDKGHGSRGADSQPPGSSTSSSVPAAAATPSSSSFSSSPRGLQMMQPLPPAGAAAAPSHHQQSSPRWGRPSSAPTLPSSPPAAAATAAAAAASLPPSAASAMRTPLLERGRPTSSSHVAAVDDEEAGSTAMRPLGPASTATGLPYMRGRPGQHSPLPVQQASRLVERHGKRTGQAKTRWNVTRVGRWSIQDNLESLIFDSFNQLLMAPPYYTLLALAATYLLIVLAFAAIYMVIAADANCGMEIGNFLEGYYFSLETMATVGYGVQDEYFAGCRAPAFFITAQILLALLFESCTLGLVFIRFSRPGKRALTVLFSDRATLGPLSHTEPKKGADGTGEGVPLALSFRITELTRYELIEPRVRLYAIRHCSNSSSSSTASTLLEDRLFFHAFPLQLHTPQSGLLLMTLPATVTHVLEADSPLVPPGWNTRRDDGDGNGVSGFVSEGERAALERFWAEEEVEVVVLVEGTDPLTSNSLQAKFSYKLPQDLAVNHAFAPCVGARHHDGGCVVDLTRFHATRPLVLSSESRAASVRL